MKTVGLIGMGTMGKGIAHCLAKQGYRVLAWNRTPLPTEPEMETMRIVRHLPEVSEAAAAIILCVADYQAAHDVIVQLHLEASQLHPVLLQCGTISPQQVSQLKTQAAAYASTLLDVGMLGNHHHARAGELRLFVGGEEETFAAMQTLLTAISKQVTYVGSHGMGMVIKLALNLLMGIEMEALAEAVTFGEHYGIERQLLIEALTTSGFSSPVMSFKARRLLAQHYDTPDFRLTLMHKDMDLFMQACVARGIELPAAKSSLSLLQTAMEHGLGDKDCIGIQLALPLLAQAPVE